MIPSKEDNQESFESRIERKDVETQVSSNLVLFDEEFKQSQSNVQNEASSKKLTRSIGKIDIKFDSYFVLLFNFRQSIKSP